MMRKALVYFSRPSFVSCVPPCRHGDNNWYLLTFNKGYKLPNGATDDGDWSDPGRLWEPSLSGGSANAGHVLSQTGLNGHDVNKCNSDVYLLYGKD